MLLIRYCCGQDIVWEDAVTDPKVGLFLKLVYLIDNLTEESQIPIIGNMTNISPDNCPNVKISLGKMGFLHCPSKSAKSCFHFYSRPNLTCSHISRSASEAPAIWNYSAVFKLLYKMLLIVLSVKITFAKSNSSLQKQRLHPFLPTVLIRVNRDDGQYDESFPEVTWTPHHSHNIMHNVNKAVAACQHCSRLHYGNVWLIMGALIHQTAICIEMPLYWKDTGHF